MKSLFLLLAIPLNFLPLWAQRSAYRGRLIGPDSLSKKYLITLRSTKDSTLFYSALSDENHTFAFTGIPNGDYERCVIELKSSEPLLCDPLQIPFHRARDVIYIDTRTVHLKGVSITAKKPLIRFESGVLVVNVKDNPIFSSGTLFEMIPKMPGISYDAISQTLRLNGKSGIGIRVDGRTLHLSGTALIAYLRSIPADDVVRVEINTAPDASYDASGSGGFIDIKTKEIKRKGVYISASVTGTQGRFFDAAHVSRIQYNTAKNRYALSYYSYLDRDFEEARVRRIRFNQWRSLQNTYAIIKGVSHYMRASYGHTFRNAKLKVHASLSPYRERIPQVTDLQLFRPAAQEPHATNHSENHSRNQLRSYNLGAYYDLKKKGKWHLDMGAGYLYYDIDNHSLLKSYDPSSKSGYPDLENTAPNRIDIFSSSVDYTRHPDTLSKMKFGFRADWENLKNKNEFFNQRADGRRRFDRDKSNSYGYREWTLGVYGQYFRKFTPHTELTAGLRMETNPSKGRSRVRDFSLSKTRTNLFPYLNISYSPNANHSFNLSYNKRINRPAFKFLLPYTYFLDPFTRLTGNPQLKPQTTRQVQLQYIFGEKYFFALSYNSAENQIFQTPILDAEYQSSLLPLNLKRGRDLTLSSNVNWKLCPGWQMNANALLQYERTANKSDSISIDIDNWTGQFTITNQIDLLKHFNSVFTIYYQSPYLNGAYKVQGVFTLDASISRSFFKQSLDISLTASDVLNTYRAIHTLHTTREMLRFDQNFDNRWLQLNLTYSFQKGLQKSKLKADKNLDEIEGRVR